MKTSECYHEGGSKPREGGRSGETVCLDCGEEFLYCEGCSECNMAGMPIYHATPMCRASGKRTLNLGIAGIL